MPFQIETYNQARKHETLLCFCCRCVHFYVWPHDMNSAVFIFNYFDPTELNDATQMYWCIVEKRSKIKKKNANVLTNILFIALKQFR